MIEINGSYLEGGGQIIRTAIGLSAVTEKPCRIYNIRANRPTPGLKAQHLKGIEAVAKLCNGKLKNAEIGSAEVTFIPNKIQDKPLFVDVGTAGSVTLVLQTLLVPIIHCKKPIKITLVGGTNVKWSPDIEYFKNVFCYFLKQIGVDVKTKILRYGFYPKGGGKVEVSVKPSEPKPLVLEEREEPEKIKLVSVASKLLQKAEVAERQIKGFKETFNEKVPIDEEIKYVDSLCAGSSLHTTIHYKNSRFGVTALGERGLKAEIVGQRVAQESIKLHKSKATVDEHLSDQILPFLALANGKSEIAATALTNHTKTNIWVIKKFLQTDFKINENGNVKIGCNGS